MKTLFIVAIVASVLATGCASSGPYSKAQSGQMMNAVPGTIESVRKTNTRDQSMTAPVVGAVVGTAGGAYVGHRYAKTHTMSSDVAKRNVVGGGAVAGAVGGAVVGGVVQGLFPDTVQELVIKLKDGTRVAIIQSLDMSFKPGEAVSVVNTGEEYVVTKNVAQ